MLYDVKNADFSDLFYIAENSSGVLAAVGVGGLLLVWISRYSFDSFKFVDLPNRVCPGPSD